VEIYRQWNNVKVRYHKDYFKLTVTLLFIIFVILTLVWRHRTLHTHGRLMGQKNAEIESLQTSLLDRNRTLEFLSAHDTLTGLYNRNHMIQKSEEEIYRFRRFHTVPSMIIVELYQGIDPRLDNHDAHKKHYLKALASVCLATVREVDVVSRYTEGQIVVLCPQTNLDEGQILADRLLSAIDKNAELADMQMVASIGLAQLKEGENFSDWIERATKALYQAKRQRANRVAVAD
jgi:diguanylate cyclase (GGDEF)-like protein